MNEEDYLNQFFLELDFDSLDMFSTNDGLVKSRFSDIVKMLVFQGPQTLLDGSFFKEILSSITYEIVQLKPMMVQVLCVACVFSIGNRMLEGKNVRISKISFLMIYAMVLFLLMKPFSGIVNLVECGVDNMISFMTAFIPTYSSCLILMGRPISASMFSQLTMLIIYIIEWGISKIIFPLIHSYIFLVFLNHVFEEEKLSKLADLVQHLVSWLLKIMLGFVLSMGTVQSLLAPARDVVISGGILKGAKLIPGIGNSVESVGEVFLSCGQIVKNSVGITGLIVMASICLIPLVKIWIVNMVYRFLAAILEPLSDGRIVKMTHKIAQAIEMYLMAMLYSVIFIVIVIAMVSAATNL